MSYGTRSMGTHTPPVKNWRMSVLRRNSPPWFVMRVCLIWAANLAGLIAMSTSMVLRQGIWLTTATPPMAAHSVWAIPGIFWMDLRV
ncbi:hypothetical protein BJX99DRAFT_231672 [Aspergillus californicus]